MPTADKLSLEHQTREYRAGGAVEAFIARHSHPDHTKDTVCFNHQLSGQGWTFKPDHTKVGRYVGQGKRAHTDYRAGATR